MKLLARMLGAENAMPVLPASRSRSLFSNVGTPKDTYRKYAGAYSGNEIVFAAVEMLASSAAEPHIIGRRWQRQSPTFRNALNEYDGHGTPQEVIRDLADGLVAKGLNRRQIKRWLTRNGFVRELPSHPLVKLLQQPNPWVSRGQMWGTVVMDRALAGNSYLYKARLQDGPLKGTVGELWRLRPDRIKIIPDAKSFIAGYEYSTGSSPNDEKVTFPPEDIIHFKTRNPLNDYYGMPPLMAATGRVDIDQWMKQYLSGFYSSGGIGPGAILTTKQKLTEAQRDEIRERKNRIFRGPGGVSEWLILDANESSFEQLGLDRGLRDALPQEIDALSEARIAMVFGIPGSILGLRIGYESSSYANKRQDWQVFWDLTMVPLLSDLDDTLNLQLVPEFKQIDEVMFDLSDIRALQEDVDAMQKRHRDNVMSGLMSWEEGRDALGLDPQDVKGKTFFVPVAVNPTPGESVSLVSLPGAPETPTGTSVDNPPVAEVRHWCSLLGHGGDRLVAKDVEGDPELYCDRCSTTFRASDKPQTVSVQEIDREDGKIVRVRSREEAVV